MKMKSISPNGSFTFNYMPVVESSDSSNSSDIFIQEDINETDVLSGGFLSYSVKENVPQLIHSVESAGVEGKIRLVYKTSEEYHRRRQRNNLAVRKSRDKAKQKQKESQYRLQELTAENKRLQLKAELLMKELIVLKGLFPAIGETPPPEVDEFLADE